MAIPASTSSWAVLDAGGKRLGSRSARLSSASSRRPIRSSRRISDSAHARHSDGHRALRASPALRRAYSPSCFIAMPRSASAGGSSRKATRFNAPRGSPAASARAAALINESIGIPPHLSLPPFRHPAVNIAHGHRVKPRTATRTKDIRRAFETKELKK
jgi:hypothetical protein